MKTASSSNQLFGEGYRTETRHDSSFVDGKQDGGKERSGGNGWRILVV